MAGLWCSVLVSVNVNGLMDLGQMVDLLWYITWDKRYTVWVWKQCVDRQNETPQKSNILPFLI